MANFQAFRGVVMMIDDFFVNATGEGAGCYKLITLDNGYGAVVNFVVSPNTYFVDHVTLNIGDRVTGFYDGNAPVPLIFPPQFRAIVMARDNRYENVKVDFFNSELISSDNSLRLNIGPNTKIVLENNQLFTQDPASRNLIVVYGATTKSIPAQTTPSKIIVMC